MSEAKKGWVIVTPGEGALSEEARKYLEDRGHTVIEADFNTTDEAIRELEKYKPDAMINRTTMTNRAFFEAAAPNLKAMARYGAGYEVIDQKLAEEFGVKCVYAPVGNSYSVAEVTLFHMLHAVLNMSEVRDVMMTESFYKAKHLTPYDNLCYKTVGIIGCGNAGSRVAELCMGFKMNVMAYDPFKPAKDFPEGVRVVRDLDTLLSESDFVTVHAPDTKVTKNMINKDTLAKMKPTAVLINCARGNLVSEPDLLEAVKNGVIAGAELDTCAREPLALDREVLHSPGVYVTPHMPGSTISAKRRVCMMCAIGIQEIYEGKEPSWPVPFIDWDSAPVYTDVREDWYHAPDILDIRSI